MTIASPAAYVDPSCTIGAGTVIAPGAVLTIDVVIGGHCQVNVGAVLSHNVYLASFEPISPGHAPHGMGAPRRRSVRRHRGEDLERRDNRIRGRGRRWRAVLADVLTPHAIVAGPSAPVVKVREWIA